MSHRCQHFSWNIHSSPSWYLLCLERFEILLANQTLPWYTDVTEKLYHLFMGMSFSYCLLLCCPHRSSLFQSLCRHGAVAVFIWEQGCKAQASQNQDLPAEPFTCRQPWVYSMSFCLLSICTTHVECMLYLFVVWNPMSDSWEQKNTTFTWYHSLIWRSCENSRML